MPASIFFVCCLDEQRRETIRQQHSELNGRGSLIGWPCQEIKSGEQCKIVVIHKTRGVGKGNDGKNKLIWILIFIVNYHVSHNEKNNA